ncbi:uncharacterized protein LOC114520904 isoform X2 [Dendronephthya gigantea]|uniref:ATP-dependent DNA helicase Q-like 4A n=2 Tax=Dendronephthya gigantea TaxID=151771 RepID=UPI001069678E|nr:ATP-dependent DNA helicase Q-like 4A [Dendronephthya gigantea]XP_028397053.1 uncharacterized protein LOC114520904 isoform X2 [Dendronephthya gigantea]
MDETINQTKNVLSLTTRPFQEANVSGKVICSKCYENTKEIKFYLEDAGLIQHFRVKHRHMALDERLVKECRLLFQDLHGQETFSVLQKLAKIRGEANVNCCSLQKYEEFSVEHITENLANKMTTLKVMASTRREAAKLYGLYLKHSGILKHLSGNPCHVRVKISSSVTDHLGQCFKLWDACAKIYAECFVSPKRSMLLPRHQTPVPDKCLQMQISRECKTPLQFLQTVFGHQEFRPGQGEAIEFILSGEDTVVIIPTGGGKTVIYTLPCLMTPGLAFVVSPLIMLMSDQVARLQQCGINTCYYNTMLTDNERQNILHNLKQPDCQYQFLFISPEAIVTEQLKHCLSQISHENRLSFFIIDEAHCISTWGKEFRPAYQQLGTLRSYNVPIIALTGTATTETLDAIKQTLEMDNPKVVKMPCRRENLIYSVVNKDNKAKEQVCKIIEDDFADVCGIIYCATQADTVEIAFTLKEHGVTATYYHAGMEGGQRMQNALLWLENKKIIYRSPGEEAVMDTDVIAFYYFVLVIGCSI